MGLIIAALVRKTAEEKFKLFKEELKRLKMEVVIAIHDNAFEMGIMNMRELTAFTCPEGHGALVRLVEGNLRRTHQP